jgi:hypothetical protein
MDFLIRFNLDLIGRLTLLAEEQREISFKILFFIVKDSRV